MRICYLKIIATDRKLYRFYPLKTSILSITDFIDLPLGPAQNCVPYTEELTQNSAARLYKTLCTNHTPLIVKVEQTNYSSITILYIY